jgi:hypothetical protein
MGEATGFRLTNAAHQSKPGGSGGGHHWAYASEDASGGREERREGKDGVRGSPSSNGAAYRVIKSKRGKKKHIT